jgi:hypothetical protein
LLRFDKEEKQWASMGAREFTLGPEPNTWEVYAQ